MGMIIMSKAMNVTSEEFDVVLYALKWTLQHNIHASTGLILKGHLHTMREHLRNLIGIYGNDHNDS